MAIISHKHFRGHQTLTGHFVKISAYVDNMAVHLRSLADINIYRALLRQNSLATGGITYFSKSEAVLYGKWRSDPPQIGICMVKASKYLGIRPRAGTCSHCQKGSPCLQTTR
jgi:hypothetical protein